MVPSKFGAAIAARREAAANQTQARSAADAQRYSEVLSKLTFEAFADSFTHARNMRRSVSIYTGPPNSGKTHEAMRELAKAKTGAYLAPLRLLALEGRDGLSDLGLACDLLTGEDYEPAEDGEGNEVEGSHVSSTVECVDTGRIVDCAVIDECQMLFDFTRGWAWTQAIIGVPAKKLILICAPHAVEAVQRVVAACGEMARVVQFNRKGKLQVMKEPIRLSDLQPGDAVVAFSRNDVLKMRDRISKGEGGPGATTSCSVVYGALPPEVRRMSAQRFASGEASVLCASDAIGMGLNLPIGRVIFATMQKFDGRMLRPLEVAEVHQIGGRAGRYGKKMGSGLVGVLEDACEPSAQATLERAMAQKAAPPRDFKAPVAPNQWHVQTIASGTGLTSLTDILELYFRHMRPSAADAGYASDVRGTATAFKVVESFHLLEMARALDAAAPGLRAVDRFAYATAPVGVRDRALQEEFLAWANTHSLYGEVGIPAVFVDDVEAEQADGGEMGLDQLEYRIRAATVYLYLEGKFPDAYSHKDTVVAARDRLVEAITSILISRDDLAPPHARDAIDRRAERMASAAGGGGSPGLGAGYG